MIHIDGKPNENGVMMTCKIEGPRGILAHELEQLLNVFLKDDDLAELLFEVLDKVTNKGDKK